MANSGDTFARPKSRIFACPRVTKILAIAVHDASRVCNVEGICDLNPESDELLDRHGRIADEVLEGPALEQFHDDEMFPAVFADVVDGADVQMVQRGRRARLALEPLDGDPVLENASGRNLTATRLPRRRSSARYTTPMPPQTCSRMR